MFAYYLSLIGGTRATSVGSFSPFLGAWLPNIAFFVLGIFLLARSDRQHENRVIAWPGSRDAMDRVKLGESETCRGLNLSQWAYSLTHSIPAFPACSMPMSCAASGSFSPGACAFSFRCSSWSRCSNCCRISSENKIASTVVVELLPLPDAADLYWVVPLAVLLAILINLGTLTKTNEILAVKAGAVSLYRMSLPHHSDGGDALRRRLRHAGLRASLDRTGGRTNTTKSSRDVPRRPIAIPSGS